MHARRVHNEFKRVLETGGVNSPSGFDKREWIPMAGQNKKAAHVAHGSEFTTSAYRLPLWLTTPPLPSSGALALGPGVLVPEWLPSVRKIPVDGTLGWSAGIREAGGSGPPFR